MQFLFARAQSRMLVLTAQKLGVQLPARVVDMLAAVASAAWKAQDVQMVSSCWPNVVVARNAKVGESVTMEDLLRKWEKINLEDGGQQEGGGGVDAGGLE